MSTPKQLHQQAMDVADRALVAKLTGEDARARELAKQAFEYERAAALAVAEGSSAEPTRSILLRSAAALAIDAQELREAERLIARALVGDPPPEIGEELRDLLEQVHFGRHLELRGVVLAPDEIQMSLSGIAVGFGIVRQDELVTRADGARKLLFRTAERILGRPFRERGPTPKAVRESCEVFLSSLRAASMAVSFRIGTLEQREIPGAGLGERIVDDFLSCVDTLQSAPSDLRRRIADEAYYRNFAALARVIAPDGRRVRQVGLTLIRNGQTRHVSLTKPASKLVVPEETDESTDSVARVRGRLKSADELRGHKSNIVLEDKDRATHRVVVPPGMMADIVRPMWGEDVVVAGTRQPRGAILLQTIRRAEEDEQQSTSDEA